VVFAESSICLDEKSNKKIKPEYFCTKNHRTDFPIATPAARVSHSTPGSLPTASAQILTVIFWRKNRRAGRGRFYEVIGVIVLTRIVELLVEILPSIFS
jgi:hypothetical protein